MAKILYHLGRFSFRHAWWIVASWLVIVAAAGIVGATEYQGFSSSFTISNIPSARTSTMLQEAFPGARDPMQSTDVRLVFAAPEGHTLEEENYYNAIDDVINYVQTNIPESATSSTFINPVDLNPLLIQGVIDASTAAGLSEETATADADNLRVLSADKRIGYATFSFDAPNPSAVTQQQRDYVYTARTLGQNSGLTVEINGSGLSTPIEIEPISEIMGLVVAFLVLIVTLGSAVAAGLPLLTALCGVGIGMSIVLALTHFVELNNITPVLSLMLGLAVGIDYALLIVSRYRSELDDAPPREHGQDKRGRRRAIYSRETMANAAGMAVGTAGSAVFFAALTVIIALGTLSMVRISFLSWMGALAAITVGVTMLMSLTLIPAMLGILQNKAFAGRAVRLGKGAINRRWVNLVQRRPAAVLGIIVLGLCALTSPVLQLEMGLPSDSTADIGTTQRAASDLLEEGFGAGINAPFLMLIDAQNVNPDAPLLEPLLAGTLDQPVEERQSAARTYSIQLVVDRVNTHPDVKHAQIVALNESGTVAQVLITPTTGPDDPTTTQMFTALRNLDNEVTESLGVDVGITGLNPIQQEITEKLSAALPLYLVVVVGLAIILLIMVFRSLLIPLVASFGFILSTGAACGVTVLFWQQGLWGLVGSPGPIISFMPIFLIGITFGLAMDYQVFLVSRMREFFVHTRKPHKFFNKMELSTVEGYVRGAPVVLAAALIMMSVFVANIAQPLAFVKVFGFALAAAVLFDAFFVRVALVPAAMFLMGHATWWMPAWLDKILPTLDVEGSALERMKQKEDA